MDVSRLQEIYRGDPDKVLKGGDVMSTEKKPRYQAREDKGKFNNLKDIERLCDIICRTPKDENKRCFTAEIMGRKTFVCTHSNRTCALYSDNAEYHNVIETETEFSTWPKFVQVFTMLHEIAHLKLGHIDFITDHDILQGLDVLKSLLFDLGNERIEIEADTWAKNFMALDREQYIACIDVYKDQGKRQWKNDRFYLNWYIKIMDGRVKHVLRRSPN